MSLAILMLAVSSSPFCAESDGANIELDVLNPPGQLVDRGGYRLHIHCEGEGSPAVVMDAGLGGLSLEWLRVQGFLKHYAKTCSYDRAGYGWSDPGPEPRTSSLMVDELFQLLHNAQVRGPYILVGHSFGGYNAQLFAERYANLTAGVVLVDSSHPDQIERFLAPPLNMNTAPSRETSAVMLMPGPPLLPAHMPEDARTAAMMLMSLRKTRSTLAEEYLYFRESAAAVREGGAFPSVPLVVISRGVAERDTATEHGRLAEALWLTLQDELAEKGARSAHLIANASGHHVHLDQPQLVVDAVTMVLDFTRAPAATSEPAINAPSTWLAFDGATWRSDRLHSAPEEYFFEPSVQIAATLPRQAGHVAWTAAPGDQRVPYLQRVSFAQ
ncbi:MAG: alpha/beta fold hydrolase [Chromatiales bacterium]